MAIKHIPDGQDFGAADFSKDFGFHGSAEGPRRTAAPPFASDEPTRGPKGVPEPMEVGGGAYAHGGEVHHPHGHHVVRVEHRADGGKIHHHAHGGHSVEHPDGHMSHHHHDGSPVAHMAHGGAESHMHPHGHHVVHVEHHSDGRVVHHHEHGGHSVHHMDGRITHHHEDGSPALLIGVAAPRGIEHQHDESEYVHRARGGHMAPEKKMIKSAIRQHDEHEHGGAHEDIHLARGGAAGKHVRLPRGMKPVGERMHSPIETPPRNPNLTTTPRNEMSGGQMPYGVEPSSEPDMAGSDQGIPQLAHGGRMKRHR